MNRARRPRGPACRCARVRALAKINLDLRVLARRPDDYHELRTIFQTISLADTIHMAFTPGPKTTIQLEDRLGIPDNLMTRAARAALDAMRATGRVEMRLKKRIPMGAGLGGGSSDAAAVLLALPVLAGRPLEPSKLRELAAQLGSDVPFFLLGGTAVGIGRGDELFPLPEAPPGPAVLVAPDVHVSTAGAYRRLSPRLTSKSQQNKIFTFQLHAWNPGGVPGENDFESVVFEQHRRLASLKKLLIRAGASPAMMTGSGCALFGFFRTGGEVSRALALLKEKAGEENTFRISAVSRARYRSLWWRALEEHAIPRIWPPQSRYLR